MSDFGAELRRRRTSAGMSLTGLAASVHFTKGYLSKVENGKARVNRDLAQAVDRALDARGELLALVPDRVRPAAPQVSASAVDDGPMVIGTAALPLLQGLLDQYRTLTRVATPRLAIDAVRDVATRLQQHLGRRDEAVTVLAAQAAELAGWIEQETGDLQAALRWTLQSRELATAADRADLAGFAHLRLADLALETKDVDSALAHVVTARHSFDAADPWLQGLLAARQARVHALRGDKAEVVHALAVVEGMPAGSSGGYGEDSSLGGAVLPAVTTGWALFELGEDLPATCRALRDAFEVVPPDHARLRHRVRARLALAQAEDGDLDAAGEHVVTLVEDARVLESATAQSDLRRLRETLGKWDGTEVDILRALLAERLQPSASDPDQARVW
ncbi:XRE family transcriptional regulator [Amycolatopsis mediterranei S699]|uniref:XRE family transcriptional regulator n=2 Tax=Amycolatopsis mediterranei TaxID=33910 RepID=A0A0H3CYG2_AMYMU|nr:helix-turn-helix transcriptional regulator [Amycolatopsis mediterranei]ADJ43383.1 XRE family transcriptional regulator [Amycolatopsis mediterranei U32]AEK40085.1 XRE family transcriptional regulator [Amycolatopsis mediterranei S699]AFO75096.1 XRE family transcriptional regulator [Amycolatopsis mediterranei S699]AGT82225.1 XRE family transcriptional regulator [Amycolatopsis mediterranei RB]KDO11712.1 XRE family transcriptional regulator [Amycolatopsis mediterranei]